MKKHVLPVLIFMLLAVSLSGCFWYGGDGGYGRPGYYGGGGGNYYGGGGDGGGRDGGDGGDGH